MSDDRPPHATDPSGREVVFGESTREHLVRRRRRHLLDQLPVILDAVSRPDYHEADPIPGRERFYRYNPISGRWLRVVVDFNEKPGLIVTAVSQRTDPSPTS
jgi:hypothetical protein